MEGALTTTKVGGYRPLLLMVRRHPKISALAATLIACSCPFTLPLLMLSSPLLLLTIAFSRLLRWRWRAARLFLRNSASSLFTLFPKSESRSNLITLWCSDNIADDPLPCSFFYKVEGFVDEFGEIRAGQSRRCSPFLSIIFGLVQERNKMEGFLDELGEVIRDLVAQSIFFLG